MVDASRLMARVANSQRVASPTLYGVEVTVIDDSDIVGWAASVVRLGEVYMSDVSSMVKNVIGRAGGYQIRRLNILDHGNARGVQFGEDWLSAANVQSYAVQLGQLNGRFHTLGFVHLQHCDAGQNHALLGRFSAIFGVPVYAGTGLHNPVYRFNRGQYERCVPNGDCESDVGRP